MQEEEGKRPRSPPHEQLSPSPAGIPPLSTPPSSLTTPPAPLKKKKLLKVILKSPPPNPNCLSPPSPPSLSSSAPPFPHPHPNPHHSLQQRQLHHHQQLLLQQQHLHKQRLLQQQTQQLASELQLKLHQQQLLQQQHPRLLEQFKQQLQQEQISASSSSLDLQSCAGSCPLPLAAAPLGNDQRENFLRFELQEKAEDSRSASSRRRWDRSRGISGDVAAEERFALQKSRFQPEEGKSDGWQQIRGSVRENGQEHPSRLLLQELGNGELAAKRPKLSDQHLHGSTLVQSSLRNAQNAGSTLQGPVLGLDGVIRTPQPPVAFANGFLGPLRTSSAPSSAVLPNSQYPGWPGSSSDAVNTSKPISRSNSEGKGPSGRIATDPSSKAPGGLGNASVPGKKVLRGILDKLQKKDSFGAFSEPVDANEVPDYYDVIKDPMDFGTMRKRISSNFYTTLELFERDIFAICNNAMTFNGTGTVYHRQARSIKAAAERILGALRASDIARVEAILKHKPGGSHPKRSHKKKQPWTSEYVTDTLPNVGGRGFGRPSGPVYVGDSYYVDWQGGALQTSSKGNLDDKEDPAWSLAKSYGCIDGRRWPLNEESRRGTYRPPSTDETSSLVTTVCGGSLQFVPAAFQFEFSYARSLARFAADLGPEVWKVAQEKVRKSLPSGMPFGPGWVGQRESPGRPMMPSGNKVQVHDGTMDSLRKAEDCSSNIGEHGVGNGVGNDHALVATVVPVNYEGVIMKANEEGTTCNVEGAGTYTAAHGHEGTGGLGESYHAQRSVRDRLVRDGDKRIICNQGNLTQQNLLPYTAQAVGREDALHGDEAEPTLIHGRDMEGRLFLEYKTGQSSGLHSGLVSASVSPVDGTHNKLNEDG